MSETGKNQELIVCIDADRLMISIGVDTLLHATVESGANRYLGDPDFRITDRVGFVNDYLNQLLREEEDGSTPVHMMLDKAVSDMLNNGGSLNVSFLDNEVTDNE